jgi:hypothetical protein
MPQFTLDLRWTDPTASVRNGKFLDTRQEAIALAIKPPFNIKIVSIIDRLHPPVGPIWVVEENVVNDLAKTFRQKGNVKVTVL